MIGRGSRVDVIESSAELLGLSPGLHATRSGSRSCMNGRHIRQPSRRPAPTRRPRPFIHIPASLRSAILRSMAVRVSDSWWQWQLPLLFRVVVRGLAAAVRALAAVVSSTTHASILIDDCLVDDWLVDDRSMIRRREPILSIYTRLRYKNKSVYVIHFTSTQISPPTIDPTRHT